MKHSTGNSKASVLRPQQMPKCCRLLYDTVHSQIAAHTGSAIQLYCLFCHVLLTFRMSHTSTVPSPQPAAASTPSSCTVKLQTPPLPLTQLLLFAVAPDPGAAAGKSKLAAALSGFRRSQRYTAAAESLLLLLLGLLSPVSSASRLRCSRCSAETELPRPATSTTHV
jgi:hypothetical protein